MNIIGHLRRQYNLPPLFQLFDDYGKSYNLAEVLSIFTDNYGLYLECDCAVKIMYEPPWSEIKDERVFPCQTVV